VKELHKYYVVTQKAMPKILLCVIEAKRMLAANQALSVQEAVSAVGISRSSFYKYNEEIFEFHGKTAETTLTLTFEMQDEPGFLADVLRVIAEFKANILTIHQSIPIGGIASLTLSIQILKETGDVAGMMTALEQHPGVGRVRMLAKEL
jgi:chorismate mutase